MPNYCKLIIAGHLSRDPELRHTNSGMVVVGSAIAFNHGSAEKKEACFVDLTVWDKQGTRFADWFRKGDAVLVEGRLRQEHWEDKAGAKRSKLSMTVDRFESLKQRTRTEESAPATSAPSQSSDDAPPF